MSEIRLLTERDYEESLRLSQYAFQYELTEEQKETQKQLMKTQEIWGDFENGQLTAKLHLIPFTVMIQGKEFKMGGVAGVATWPEHRRKGKIANLLKIALEEMRKKRQSISFLHPFEVHFYRRFGWELFASYKKLTIENKQLVFLPPASGRIERVAKTDRFAILQPIYEAYSLQYNGMLKRTLLWWENRVFTKDMHAVVYMNGQNEKTGYMLYEMKNRHMDVQEMIVLDEEARRGLWNFICQHDSMADKVTMILPVDDPLPYLLHNPRMTQEVFPYFMGRIVDVERFLQEYPFVKPKESLFLHVYDEFAPWNTGVYQLSAEGVKAFRKEPQNAACAHPPKRGLQIDINTVAALFLGYERPFSFYKMGKLKGSINEIERLETMIPRRSTFFPDFF